MLLKSTLVDQYKNLKNFILNNDDPRQASQQQAEIPLDHRGPPTVEA